MLHTSTDPLGQCQAGNPSADGATCGRACMHLSHRSPISMGRHIVIVCELYWTAVTALAVPTKRYMCPGLDLGARLAQVKCKHCTALVKVTSAPHSAMARWQGN